SRWLEGDSAPTAAAKKRATAQSVLVRPHASCRSQARSIHSSARLSHTAARRMPRSDHALTPTTHPNLTARSSPNVLLPSWIGLGRGRRAPLPGPEARAEYSVDF